MVHRGELHTLEIELMQFVFGKLPNELDFPLDPAIAYCHDHLLRNQPLRKTLKDYLLQVSDAQVHDTRAKLPFSALIVNWQVGREYLDFLIRQAELMERSGFIHGLGSRLPLLSLYRVHHQLLLAVLLVFVLPFMAALLGHHECNPVLYLLLSLSTRIAIHHKGIAILFIQFQWLNF